MRSDLRAVFTETAPMIDPATRQRLVSWTDELSVRSPTLDLHHQILVGCLNRMILLEPVWRDSLPAVYRELLMIVSYCKIHFFIEEEAMRKAGVAAATVEEHGAIHRRILGKMDQSVKAFNTDPAAFPFAETLKFLHMWLVRHILDEDRRHYAEAMASRREVEADIARFRYAQIARKLRQRETGSDGASAGEALSGRWVAVIESNMERRNALIRTLKDQGMQVAQTNRVLDAPALIEAHAPELVFLDWSAEYAGRFARELYRTRSTLVIATLFGDPFEIVEECDTLGVANILGYPCSAQDLVTVTRETLDALVPLRALLLERLGAPA
ncbi:hemerythrin domain-containing protein [Roseospirillum parvum]|uniref:Hemerythrin-like metal-binding domain protein n=1 Tax=Roseospirillum parvum TaxID=83401 RepID=A0A1G7U402_9PROT|nr:hemerythrin domain-containing protein [Roseospirillum parvum]SDG42352.1 hemerythrin-like metal-binding domain protein [Roseospirillum parvum]